VPPRFAGSPLPAVGADAVGHADRLADTHRLDHDRHDPAAHDDHHTDSHDDADNHDDDPAV
jgi:hypothetical protein